MRASRVSSLWMAQQSDGPRIRRFRGCVADISNAFEKLPTHSPVCACTPVQAVAIAGRFSRLQPFETDESATQTAAGGIDHRPGTEAQGCRSSGVEHSLGKGEVESSNLSGSTSLLSRESRDHQISTSLRSSSVISAGASLENDDALMCIPSNRAGKAHQPLPLAVIVAEPVPALARHARSANDMQPVARALSLPGSASRRGCIRACMDRAWQAVAGSVKRSGKNRCFTSCILSLA